jgi:DNA mismatch repair protein MutS
MSFYSVLFPQNYSVSENPDAEPAFFPDLNLDQIIRTILSGKQEYNLEPFLHSSLHSSDATRFRHEVMRDLEDAG